MQPATQIELRSNVQPRDPATQPFRVVLHKTTNDEWVTHLENVTEVAHKRKKTQAVNISPCGKYCSKCIPDYYWGHYYGKNYGEALADYRIRRNRYNL